MGDRDEKQRAVADRTLTVTTDLMRECRAVRLETLAYLLDIVRLEARRIAMDGDESHA